MSNNFEFLIIFLDRIDGIYRIQIGVSPLRGLKEGGGGHLLAAAYAPRLIYWRSFGPKKEFAVFIYMTTHRKPNCYGLIQITLGTRRTGLNS